MARIVVDPVTRIEGHLRIEAELDGNTITDAISSGTIFRGLEIILKDRDPRDAWAYTQRICGVCTHTHALASIRCVEDALKIKIPKNANIIRNMMAAAQDVHDHVVHFYHLHGFDWIDVVSALGASPEEASAHARAISPDWHLNSANYFREIQSKLKNLLDSGHPGLFANGYWGHAAYKLSAPANLVCVAHYIEALNWQKEIVKIHTVFGGKNPHPNYVVGGVPASINLDDNSVINIERLNLVRTKIDEAINFIEKVYIPDVMSIAEFYSDWHDGKGVINYMSYGDFPTDSIDNPKSFRVPRGIVMDGNLNEVLDIDLKDKSQIKEFVSHAWFRYDGNPAGGGLHPYDGQTIVDYSDGPSVPYTQLDKNKGYTWSKAPRWNGAPMEVGPLARCIVAYASNDNRVRHDVDEALGRLRLPITALHSTLGRTLARALEVRQRVHLLKDLYQELIDNISTGDTSTFNKDKWDPEKWPDTAEGVGFCEAPRGALGHWVRIKNKKIENYQCVVPTTWNASPRDANGKQGPYEVALQNTRLLNSEQPLELLRTIHSYDPCIACATHLLDPNGNELMTIKVK